LLAANLAADNEEERVEEEDEPLVGQDDPQKPELSALRQDPQWTQILQKYSKAHF
jgi:hypothetical protein